MTDDEINALSDAELDSLIIATNPSNAAIHSPTKPLAPSKKPVELMSDDEINALSEEELDRLIVETNPSNLKQEEKSFKDSALETVAEVGQFIDAYTGAPTRAAITELASTGSPFAAAQRFTQQFGENPELAPTGKEMAQGLGIPSDVGLSDIIPSIEKGSALDITPAGAVGFGIELVADPTNFIPFKTIAKGVAAGAKQVTKGAKVAAKGGKAVLVGSAKAASIENGVQTLADIAKGTSKNLARGVKDIITPTIADDFADLSSIAAKNGIDPKDLPEAIEFGTESFTSRQARSLAEGPLGQAKLEKFNKVANQIAESTKGKIESISGGRVLDDVEVGELIRAGYNDGVDRFFKGMDITYDSIIKQVPGITLTDDAARAINSKLSGIEKFAKGRMKRGMSAEIRSQAKELLNTIKAYKNTNGSLKQLKEVMNDIGDMAYKAGPPGAKIPSDVKKLREMYSVFSDGFVETTRKRLGNTLADNLVINNMEMSKHFGDDALIGKVFKREGLDGKQIFNRIGKNASLEELEALKNIVDEDTFNVLKANYLDRLISKNPEGLINYGSSILNIEKNARVAHMFGPELKEVNDLLRLGQRMGASKLSTSGTSAGNAFQRTIETIKSAAYDEATLEALKARGRRAAQKTPVAKKPISALEYIGKLDKPGAKASKNILRSIGTSETNRKREQAFKEK